MKILTLIFALMFSGLIMAQNADSAWILEHYSKKEVYIPMRDGIRLFTSVYTPRDNSEKHPILMNRTPYSCAPYGEDKFRGFWFNHYREYCKENYILVIQDVRGRWMSEGQFMDVRPFNKNKKGNTEIDEASDTYDTIEWLTKNLEGNNGNVGVFGISYPGFYSTMAALSNHPALKAVSPQAPVTDWFIGDDFHHNGAFFMMDGFSFYNNFGRPRPKPTTQGPQLRDIFYTKDSYKYYLELGPVRNTMDRYFKDTIAFWKEMFEHPNYDTWWQARDARRGLYNVQPAMLWVGGLFDAEDCWGAWNAYKACEKQSPGTNNRIVMGPWVHGGWARGDGSQLGNVQFGSRTSEWYAANVEIPFFNYYLKGKDEAKANGLPEATIFMSGGNYWSKFESWPPKAAEEKEIFFMAGGKMSWEKPKEKNSLSEYISDPMKPVPYTEDVHFRRTNAYMTDDQRFASRRPDVLVFETPVLNADLTLTGPVIADLMVSISATDADFVVKLIDVFPDDFSYKKGGPSDQGRNGPAAYPMGGYQMLVRGEIMRGRYRNSFEKPEAFIPGKPARVKFELPDVAHVFKKGHRLMIQVQSSWFPLADRNPQKFVNIYTATERDFQKATIKLHHDANNASKIILPVLKKKTVIINHDY